MNEPALRIDELRLRVSGIDPRNARRFAEQVAQQLAVQVPRSLPTQQIGALHVRLPQPTSTRLPAADAVAAKILRRLA